MGRSVFGIKEEFNALSLFYDKPRISTPGRKTIEVVVQPLLVRTFAVRIKKKIMHILQRSAVTGWEGVSMQGEFKGSKNGSLRNTYIVLKVRRAPTI